MEAVMAELTQPSIHQRPVADVVTRLRGAYAALEALELVAIEADFKPNFMLGGTVHPAGPIGTATSRIGFLTMSGEYTSKRNNNEFENLRAKVRLEAVATLRDQVLMVGPAAKASHTPLFVLTTVYTVEMFAVEIVYVKSGDGDSEPIRCEYCTIALLQDVADVERFYVVQNVLVHAVELAVLQAALVNTLEVFRDPLAIEQHLAAGREKRRTDGAAGAPPAGMPNAAAVTAPGDVPTGPLVAHTNLSRVYKDGGLIVKDTNLLLGLNEAVVRSCLGIPCVSCQRLDYSTVRLVIPFPDGVSWPTSALAAKVAVRGLLEKLVSMHKRHVIHRDIKPENIIIAPDNAVHVIDYGFATFEGLSDIMDEVGTGLYRSPDQVVSTKSDIYSAGMTWLAWLYRVTVGHVAGPSNLLSMLHRDELSTCDKDLLRQMLAPNLAARISAEAALAHAAWNEVVIPPSKRRRTFSAPPIMEMLA
eukprot:TRINITY_DN1740_c0_g4_i1.p1 TRINITY_DN1740_c0_g4~~TRINITY_DN1740_c0_g4_i1.p1  ORF type:complete len:474 (+),score=81.11 TRINITY_DN1740_c0_g4_i1:785-2206(+)